MNFLSKFGFTYKERLLIAVLLCALLAGILVSIFKQRASFVESSALSGKDSIVIYQLQNLPARASTGAGAPISKDVDKTSVNKYQLIDINTANTIQLEELPGIGPKLAKRIVEYREKHGLFQSKESLIEVEGIGEKRLNKIRDLITLSIP